METLTMKDTLLKMMNALDFQIHDISYESGYELVAKVAQDGTIIWWPIELEGSGFERLFKGSIRRIFE